MELVQFGNLCGKKPLILFDSGSSSNFISEQLAKSFTNWVALSKPVVVRVVNGSSILCSHQLSNCEVKIQGHSFMLDLKILPLKCYDVIIGMDWLELYCPMEIHWHKKWMSFLYKGQRINIQGLHHSVNQTQQISVCQLEQLISNDEIWCLLELSAMNTDKINQEWPHEVMAPIKSFEDIFEKPHGLPPHRPHQLSIPLIPGAQPFRIMPYKYNPAQKDEIEKQVAELLKLGMIQESTSPFASPALLVKKKSGEWRLCVDYRKLNSLTIKNRYPMPVMEEFLDELAGAIWFSSLDLRSGFHQVKVKEADQFKTAFQTHSGHNEYKVMPYGVTGGPATFQCVMNYVLSPLLRKCVVVFIDDILIYIKS